MDLSTRKKVLVGCTGSVATIKLPQLVKQLCQADVEVRIVVTERAKHFLKEAELPGGVQVLSDTVEWAAWQGRGDPVLHIDLAKWADLFLIAPLDANSLGKLASGICDNILTCVARAWDVNKPFLFCPAMNTKMWEHPVTAPQIAMLKSWGYKEISCISKTLMCGDVGMGGMAEVDTIVQATLRYLNMSRGSLNRSHGSLRATQESYQDDIIYGSSSMIHGSLNRSHGSLVNVAHEPINTHTRYNVSHDPFSTPATHSSSLNTTHRTLNRSYGSLNVDHEPYSSSHGGRYSTSHEPLNMGHGSLNRSLTPHEFNDWDRYSRSPTPNFSRRRVERL